MMLTVLRAAAILLAVVAAIDPAWTSQQKAALPVDVRAAGNADERLAEGVRQRVRQLEDVTVDGSSSPAAIVLAGSRLRRMEYLPPGIPVSVVAAPDGPNVMVEEVSVPRPLLAGLSSSIEATLSATGMAGTVSRLALEQDGLEIAAIDHRWTAETERYTARFEHLPPKAGVGVVRVAARPDEREVAAEDNHAEAQAVVEDRKLRVLILEPRPSWTATFLRRTLEEDPVFEVTALARPSRGISARAGNPPTQISASALERFDVVIAGAPEELRDGELSALTEFSQRRGGTVVFVPDRRPSGPYAGRMAIGRFDETLVQTPIALVGTNPPMKGSEFITVVEPPAGVDILASLPQKRPGLSEHSESKAPVIVSWPTGAGRTIFSGALDAWRYRAVDDGFARFWKARIAQAAVSAPRALEIELDPAPAVAGDFVDVRARVRPTEFASGGNSIELPRVSARIVSGDGSTFPVRLWPTAEIGVFEGRVRAPEQGRHVVEVTAGTVTSSQPLIVAAGSRDSNAGSPASLRQLAAATGGVVVSTRDLAPLNNLLERIDRPLVATVLHPARSIAWLLAFIGVVSLEWWLRRRQGHA